MTEASPLWDNPDTGLKEGPFGGVIYGAEFVQGQQGNWSLQLKILADDEDEVLVGLGVGKDWASYDGGETIQGPTSRKMFSDRSGMWKWISAATKSGAGEELKRRDREDFAGKGPLTAAVWIGLRFTFDQVKEPGDRPDAEGNWKPVEGGIPAIRPVKFHPDADVPKEAKSSATGTTKGSTRSAKPPSNGSNGLSEDQHQKLVDIATIAGDYNDFSERVMEVVQGWPAEIKKGVFLQMADESWYEGLKAEA